MLQKPPDKARGLERLTYEIWCLADNDVHERQVIALQLENTLLKFERRLPPGREEYTVPGIADNDLLDRMVSAVEKVRERLLRATGVLERAGGPYAVVGGNAVAAWVA